MSYACTYDTIVIKKNKLIDAGDSEFCDACFSAIWSSLSDYDYIRYIIFKDYKDIDTSSENPDYSNENNCILSKKDIIKYVDILNKLGLHIKLDIDYIYDRNNRRGLDERNINNKDNRSNDLSAYSFLIPTTNKFICKIILNMLRYIHENNSKYGEIPKNLINIDKKLPKLNILNKVLLSHYISSYLGGGHDIITNGSITKIYSNQEKNKLFNKLKNDNGSVCDNFEYHYLSFEDKGKILQELSILFKKRKIKQALDFYKKLIKEESNKEKLKTV